MDTSYNEIAKRTRIAITAVKRSYGTEDGEFKATLFATHHIRELDDSYWQKHLGVRNPDPAQIFNILELQSHWGGADEIEVFDFTLPGGVTSYVLSVRFDEAGEIHEISMEG